MSTDGILLESAGQRLVVCDPRGRLAAAMTSAAGTTFAEAHPRTGLPDIVEHVETGRRGFSTAEMSPVTRGVWADDAGDTVVESVGGSGFTQHWSVDDDRLRIRTRWAPSPAESAAASLLRPRFDALRAQVLLHYPVLWWAVVKGMAPLHVSLLEVDGINVLMAGPGGVGKSSLVARELAAGASAVCDNLAASDGWTVHGVRESLRLPAEMASGAGGRRTTHGRREERWHGRVDSLRPDVVVVVSRGQAPSATVRPIAPEEARHALVAGTFGAGELRRFWSLAAMLSLGTRRGPAVAPVEAVAGTLTQRLPCFRLDLGARPGPPLRVLLADQLLQLGSEGVGR
ncbi:hypothetical protein ASG76_01955 [Nocardioides sp. Soil774]|uniref:hypothetical protein n=1 Tax=Nocardioides sp. Soil774 TaxID=1736408 RepID=UPI0006F6C7E0|nr:hypothetical protein [Nocardioides sp. Soil774]KRE97503.1 hypothetical protein ASG76_01955 [Nocardioides sp. Soil774]